MKRLIIFVFFLRVCCSAYCQSNENSIRSALLNTTFGGAEVEHPHPRKVLSLKDKSTAAKLNPFLYVGAGLMYFYQNVISEQIQADCSYHISCSEFTKRSIEKKGFFRGTLLGFNQLYNCFPGAVYDRSGYLINPNGKINNLLDEEN